MRRDTIRAVMRSYAGWSPPAQPCSAGARSSRFGILTIFTLFDGGQAQNILEKSAAATTALPASTKRCSVPGRAELYGAFRKAKEQIKELSQALRAAFLALASSDNVDLFFDTVLVMDPNADIKANRLRLLDELRLSVFSHLADLSQVAPEASHKSVERHAP